MRESRLRELRDVNKWFENVSRLIHSEVPVSSQPEDANINGTIPAEPGSNSRTFSLRIAWLRLETNVAIL